MKVLVTIHTDSGKELLTIDSNTFIRLKKHGSWKIRIYQSTGGKKIRSTYEFTGTDVRNTAYKKIRDAVESLYASSLTGISE